VKVTGGGLTETISVSQSAAGTQPPQPSSDNSLSKLEVVGYMLTPAFNPNVTNYGLIVPYTVETITIVATANDNKALLSGDGTYSLVVGETTVQVIVTAENGSQRTYNILITRQDNPDGNEEITTNETSVWGAGNALHIKSVKDGKAIVYNVSGKLVKVVSYHIGETIVPLSSNIYIVSTRDKTFKIIIQ
jgi:WD40 repeat protein